MFAASGQIFTYNFYDENVIMVDNKIADKESAGIGCKDYVVKMAPGLLDLLCCDYAFKKSKRFSRLQAFQNLVERHCAAKARQEDMAVNMERLAKSWGWSRPSVMRFVRNLEALNVLEVFSVVTSKMVRLREDVIIFASPNDTGR